MSVLVTGATGFVGSWLVKELVARGESVHVLHRAKSSLEDLQGLHFRSALGDVTDLASLKSACKEVDTIYHLAGVIGYSAAMRTAMEEVNVGGTANVLQAMRESKKTRLVYMSSVVAVGASFDGKPLNEESPFNVHHLNLGYFETKRKAEELVVAACKKGDVHAVILNPSTIYGAGDAKKGSRKMQLKAARGKLPFYTSGGVSIVSVHDVVQALVHALERGRSGERYILSGENITLKDLFTRIARFAGNAPPRIHLPDALVHGLGKLGDTMEHFGRKGPISSENAWTAVLYHWFDHSKAARELGFTPRPADEALAESVNWIRSQGWLT